MRASAAIPFLAGSGLLLSLAVPTVALAQVPAKPVAPPRTAVIQQAPPDEAVAPVAQTPGQPTIDPKQQTQPANQGAATPAPTAAGAQPDSGGGLQVLTGPSGGVTNIGGGSQPTSSSSYAATGTSDKRSYAAGKFALALEGIMVGWMKSMEGGAATADVVTEKVGPGGTAKKHLAGVKYEDISLSTGLDSKSLNDWIAATWKGTSTRKNGSVVAANFDSRAVSELQFFNGMIVATTFPTLDAASKDAASVTVRIAPEYTRQQSGSGVALQKGVDSKAQKKWLASSFRFSMDGLESGSSKVNRIESFTVGVKTTDNPIGELRDYEKAPGQLEFPNLKVTLPAAYADDWVNWHDHFVIKGNSSEENEKNGSIIFLDANRQTELGRVNLSHCGIFRLSPQKTESGSESIRRLEAELYCEQMEFEGKATAQ